MKEQGKFKIFISIDFLSISKHLIYSRLLPPTFLSPPRGFASMADDDWSESQSNPEVNQESPPIERNQQKRFDSLQCPLLLSYHNLQSFQFQWKNLL